MHAFRVSDAECTRPQAVIAWPSTGGLTQALCAHWRHTAFQPIIHPWMHSGRQPVSGQIRIRPKLAFGVERFRRNHSNHLLGRKAITIAALRVLFAERCLCDEYDALPATTKLWDSAPRSNDNRNAPDVRPAPSNSTPRTTPQRQRLKNAESRARRDFPKCPLSCASRKRRH